MRVLIVGAGMSGLSLAIFLKQASIDCKVIERSSGIEDIGFLLFFYKGSSDVLKKLGVWPQILKKSRRFPAYKVIDRRGKELFALDLTQESALKPSKIIKRHDLHTILANKFGTSKITFNTQVRSLKQTAKKTVIVTFSDGSKEEFDLVVGADGVHSKIRSKYFSDFSYGDYGWQSMLFWFKDDDFQTDYVEHTAAKNKYYLWGRDITDDSGVAYFAIKTRQPAGLNDFRKQFRRDKRASRLLAKTTESEVYTSPIYNSDAQKYVSGRVVLVGDAAHAVSPILALGTTLALQDAFVLSQELTNHKNIDAALKQYETQRKSVISRPIQSSQKFMNWQAKASALNRQWFVRMPTRSKQRMSDKMVKAFVILQNVEGKHQ